MSNRLKRSLWQWRGMIIAAPTATAIVLLIRSFGLLQSLEWNALDSLTRSQPALKDDRIVIVELRESDIKHGFPLPDKTLAKLLNNIKKQQPRVIGLDIYRDVPVGAGHQELVQVFRSTPNLFGIQKIGGSRDLGQVAPPPELANLGQIAANDVIVDSDGKVRRGLLGLPDREDNSTPTLGMVMALSYLQEEGIELEISDPKTFSFGKTQIPLFQANDGGYVNADTGGHQVLLNRTVQSSSFQSLSVDQVLRGDVPKDWGRDRIVLIGTTAESLNDFFYTASGYQGLFSGKLRTPGIYVHAQLTSQLLSAVLNQKPLLKVLPDVWETVWIAAWGGLGALLVWRVQNRERTVLQRSLIRGFSLTFAMIGLASAAYFAYLSNVWIPFVPALINFTGSIAIVVAYRAQTTTGLRKTLGRYLTDDVVTSLLENPNGLTLTGEVRKVTTLISDIRGFTSLSEQYSAAEIVQMLNLYLGVMTKVIRQYGGTINDLTGDGIVVFFGAPLMRSQDAASAVACALAMQAAMKIVNEQNQKLGFPQLEMGIGLNTGEVVVGNIGSENYLKYTAIGSHVNLAARVESFTVGGQVLITASTLEEVRSIVQIAGETQAQMKGVAKPVSLYDVIGIAGQYNIFLDRETDLIIELKQPISLRFGILEGKHFSDRWIEAELIALSSKGAELRSTDSPKPLSNLKLEMKGSGDSAIAVQASQDLYAKVITKPGRAECCFWIQFTTMSPQMMEMLQQLRSDRRAC